MATVRRTSLALKQIGQHIAKESQSRTTALNFLTKIAIAIAATCATFATHAQAGELCPDLGEDVRRFSVGNYVVFYLPSPDGITILRVLHGSRDIPAGGVREPMTWTITQRIRLSFFKHRGYEQPVPTNA